MILLREVQEKDLDALERLGQVPGMFNLAGDRDALRERITKSASSFSDTIAAKADAKYIFIAEDLVQKRVVGTSMIAAQHGTAEAPHFYFEVGSEEKFSDTINTGFIHGTLKLKYDTNGPSELGGLVIDTEYRNNEARLGRQISFVRFLFLAMNKSRFKKKLIAELLPPLNKKGQSPLWEAIGRRFTNMDYWEADQLCVKNKEFIFALFPSGKIYTSFLSAEARNSIGKVGKETEPAYHLLKKIGFQYKNQVDPFDGGPHLWAGTDEVLPIKRTGNYILSAETAAGKQTTESGLMCAAKGQSGQFRAVAVQAGIDGNSVRILSPLREDVTRALGLQTGDPVIFMPYY